MTIGEELTLRAVLEKVGLPELAANVGKVPVGITEAGINAALHQVDFKTDQARWFHLDAAKNCARRIRKPINDYSEFMKYADEVLRA